MLAERHSPEFRMSSRAVKVGRCESQASKPLKALRAKRTERIQYLGERSALRGFELGKAIKGWERNGFSVIEKMLNPGNPIGAFTVNEMPQDVERTPGIRAFVTRRKGRWQIPEEQIQHTGSPGENRPRSLKIEIHVPISPSSGFRFALPNGREVDAAARIKFRNPKSAFRNRLLPPLASNDLGCA